MCVPGIIFNRIIVVILGALVLQSLTAHAFELDSGALLYHAADGTEVTIVASNIAGVTSFSAKPSFYLGSSSLGKKKIKLKVIQHNATSVTLQQKKAIPAGIYSLWHTPARRQEPLLVSPNYTVMAPIVTGVDGDTGSPGATLNVSGLYFGSRPPRLWLEYTDPQSGLTKKIKCATSKKAYRPAPAGKNGLAEEGHITCRIKKGVPPGAGRCLLKCRTRTGEGFAVCPVDSGLNNAATAQAGQLIGATHINSLGYDIVDVIKALYELYKSSPSHWYSYLMLIIEYVAEDIYFKDIDAYRLVYYTSDPVGELQKVSGVVFIPKKELPANITFQAPMLSYQHGTMVYRGDSPSLNLLYAEDIIGMIFAQKYGYIVPMADYPGLGINTNQQPYCTSTVADASVDMLKATVEFLDEHYSGQARWDGSLGLIGYSEGGYVTMSLASKLQQAYTSQFPVTAVAPLDGPYSLSEAMLPVMRRHAPFKEPYFLPMVLNGYDAVYKGTTTVFSIYNSVKTSAPGVPTGFNTVLYLMINNERDSTANLSKDINQWMAKAMVDPAQYNAPRDVLSDEFSLLLDDDTSIVVDMLKENDTWRNWIPQMHMKLFHCIEDDLVTVSNTVIAMEGFISQGADTNTLLQVDYYSIDWLRSFADLFFPTLFETESIHALAAPYALVMGVEYVAEEMGLTDQNQVSFEEFLAMEALIREEGGCLQPPE
jgi:hypothetical protein